MARTNENSKQSRYVLKVVCEGEKTEPLFFTSLFEEYFSDCDIDASTVPQPNIPEDNDDVSRTRGGYKGKKRVTSASPIDAEPVIKGQPPLKWVLYAKKLLREEGVNEAWAAFDKDQHPACEAAFREAEEPVDGKMVHIAFSSRSFEYYLLLHFEYLYRSFLETECDSKTKVCGTRCEEGSNCHGEICINGYARSKGYWTETKSSDSTYPLVKDKLLRGIAHAIRLRAESEEHDASPIYSRNPYTNADRLVGRVIGIYPIDKGDEFWYSQKGDNISVSYRDSVLRISNFGERTILLSQSSIAVHNIINDEEETAIDRSILLPPGENAIVDISIGPEYVLLFRHNDKTAMFIP